MTMVSSFGGRAVEPEQRADAPRNTTDAATAHIVPTPPKIETPANSAAAMTSSSKPTAPSGRALANRIV